MKKKLLILLIVTIIIIILGPWLLYAIGLSNLSGRPERAANTISEKEAELIWQELHETGPVHVKRLGPWDYILIFTAKEPFKGYPGMKASWFIARNYNDSGLDDKRMGYWHLSGAALTIWLTRNWTTIDILSKVKAVKNKRSST